MAELPDIDDTDLAGMPAREAWVTAVRRALQRPHERIIRRAIMRRSFTKRGYVEVRLPTGRRGDITLDAATPAALETYHPSVARAAGAPTEGESPPPALDHPVQDL